MKPIVTAELQIVALGTGSTSMISHISEALNATKAAHEAVITKGVKSIVTHFTIDDMRDAPKGKDEKIESVKNEI